MRFVLLAVLVASTAWAAMAQSPTPRPYTVVGDAIPQALSSQPGDPVRGRAIVADRTLGLCLLCHSGPFPEERFQGNLAPDLRGVGSRLSAEQIRQRLIDPAKSNPDTIMPAYSKTEGLTRV